MNNFSGNADDHLIVLVTGFGPFESNGVKINVNASGKAVLLMKKDLERTLNISLVTLQVPVNYRFIDTGLPTLWNTYKPDLTIHVGVSGETQSLMLEKYARKIGYHYPDSDNFVPNDCQHAVDGPKQLSTNLQVEQICEEFNSSLPNSVLKAEVSNEAGLFICEYIYYSSLCQQGGGCKTSLFIHVPAAEKKTQFEELARSLERIVEICVNHIRKRQPL